MRLTTEKKLALEQNAKNIVDLADFVLDMYKNGEAVTATAAREKINHAIKVEGKIYGFLPSKKQISAAIALVY